MNNRRNLLIAFSAALFTPGAAFAQPKKPPIVIGWLSASSRRVRYVSEFKEALAPLGWREGAQISIDEHYANGRDDRLLALAHELAAKPPALILSQGMRAARAMTKVAPNIPLVMVTQNDPVAAGLVSSLARPGGMVTGIAGFGSELSGKRVELLIEAAPWVKRVGFLVASKSALRSNWLEIAERSTARYGVQAHIAEVAHPTDIEAAMSSLAKEGAQALVILPLALLSGESRRIVALALAKRWVVVGTTAAWAKAGALLSYGPDIAVRYRRAAFYVDRILKGANPGDIPMEQPTTFEFVVNLKTAKLLGLTMPPEIMVRATRVIE